MAMIVPGRDFTAFIAAMFVGAALCLGKLTKDAASRHVNEDRSPHSIDCNTELNVLALHDS